MIPSSYWIQPALHTIHTIMSSHDTSIGPPNTSNSWPCGWFRRETDRVISRYECSKHFWARHMRSSISQPKRDYERKSFAQPDQHLHALDLNPLCQRNYRKRVGVHHVREVQLRNIRAKTCNPCWDASWETEREVLGSVSVRFRFLKRRLKPTDVSVKTRKKQARNTSIKLRLALNAAIPWITVVSA